MKRKGVLLATILALTLSASLVHAQAGSMMLGIYGGVLKPTGDFSEGTKTGFLGAASWDYQINEMWAAGIDAAYNQTKSDEAAIRSELGMSSTDTIDKNKISIVQGSAHAKFLVPTQGNVTPYITAGFGLYHIKAELGVTVSGTPAEASASDNKVGGHGGVGVGFKAGQSLNIGIEGDYHLINTEGSSTKYITGQAGVTFKFGSTK